MELKTSSTNIRYWLRKHTLRPNRGAHGKKLDKSPYNYFCGTCGETVPSKFYGKKTRICAKCHNSADIERARQTKLKIIEYMGGGCHLCGYNKCPSCLDIHHKDPKTKDVAFVGIRKWRWARIVQELESCVLLCRNCHGEVHAGIVAL